jgi:hypothetical protein
VIAASVAASMAATPLSGPSQVSLHRQAVPATQREERLSKRQRSYCDSGGVGGRLSQ